MVHSELRTYDNKLSVWNVNNDEDLEDAIIALGSNCDHIGTMFFLKIPADDLKDMSFDSEEGDTPTHGINHKHRNIKCLNYDSLGFLITTMMRSISSDLVVKKSKSELKELLKNAYISGKIDPQLISESLKGEILKIIKTE